MANLNRHAAIAAILKELGITLSVATMSDRIQVQKAMYLAQVAGADLGYRFNWYVRGPYSPDLANEYYEAVRQPGINEYVASHGLRTRLASAKALVTARPNDTDLTAWLEATASLDYMRRTSDTGRKFGSRVQTRQAPPEPSVRPDLGCYYAASAGLILQMPEELPWAKWVSDPLYGSVPLTQVEVEVIDTRAFQRLRQVAQLGLVSLVFPSATYSRFIHSIGACHVIGDILERLGHGWRDGEASKKEWQEHRLAMLLHDVGHYFMSHATEDAAKPFYAAKRTPVQDTEVEVATGDDALFIKHESVGREILRHDEELRRVLLRAGFDPDAIAGIFTKARPTLLSSLVSSDLDADRLDYLLRSSQATGLPYGFHDRDFILRNLVELDNPKAEGLEQDEPPKFICLREKAVFAADHFLLSRMFDFLQVIYQKVVAGLEQMLQEAIRALIRLEAVSLDKPSVIAAIQGGQWYDMHDPWLWQQLKSVHVTRHEELEPKEAYSIDRLLLRRPPPLLYAHESMVRDKAASQVALHRSGFANGVGNHEFLGDKCLTWIKSFELMTARTHSFSDEQETAQNLQKVVRIECLGEPTPIFKVPQSIAAALGDQTYEMARVYS